MNINESFGMSEFPVKSIWNNLIWKIWKGFLYFYKKYSILLQEIYELKKSVK